MFASQTVTGNLEEDKVLLDSMTSLSQENALQIVLKYLNISEIKYSKANYVILKIHRDMFMKLGNIKLFNGWQQ